MCRSPELVLSCTRNDKFPQKGCSRLRETIIFKPWPARGWPWGSPGARPTVPEAAPCRAQPDMAACRTGAPVHAKRQLSSKPKLSCTRNDQIQILATSLRDPRNQAGASPALTRAGRPKKKLLVQVKCLSILPGWKMEVVAVPGTSAPVHAK